MDLYSRKASFTEVIKDDAALQFHLSRYKGGQRDNLAKMCYQYAMLNNIKIND